ncbi:ABC transporter permease [Dactylosporangium aurantiacum]|uniref:Transport permease protein n=1 Tax=Dactylosporangium aurantiacum TaxID=35754 RepID=A0A9Q9ISD9_9ACTN|nr:ABC transporter permease [Dactylosporangium aurantiacum]MDG6103707.1 ABC transporter permease [Dactylosporangium aurantiacum]UWZ59075.1 ABC transporter permease [Dactylosporangium aurantiacum]
MSTLALTNQTFRETRYWLLRYRRTWRGSIVISVVNPLLFLIAIGVGLGELVADPQALPGGTYLRFVVPGLLIAAAMQTTYVESAGPVFQSIRGRHNYQAAAATPMWPETIFYGHLVFIILRVAVTSLLFAVVAAAMGALDPLRGLLVVGCAVLVGCAFAPCVAAMAVRVRRLSTMVAILRFIVMPMYMLSGTFFPLGTVTPMLRWIAQATPLWHGVELARDAAVGTATPTGVAVHAGYLTAMTFAGLYFARRNFRRNLYV